MRNENCIVIAEVGNCHEGSLASAIEMLEQAKEAGADMVKFQAGKAEGFARTPDQVERYRKYELGRAGYDSLLRHGDFLGIPVFFSVWSKEFEDYMRLPYRKIAARQCRKDVVDKWDKEGTFVSIPHTMPLSDVSKLPIKKSVPMHVVSEYPASDALMDRSVYVAGALKVGVGRVGYSDHTLGIFWPVRMATDFCVRAPVIEKHFTLSHDFGPLRDHKLAATPKEFKEMVERIKS